MHATNRKITALLSLAPRCIFSLLVLVLSLPATLQSQTNTPSLLNPRIEWTARGSVSRYRLQIAADEKFQDMLLDRLVTGNDFQPTELAPGRYYWRVAPSQFERGAFLPPGVFYVSSARSLSESVTRPVAKVQPGWSAAIGSVDHLVLNQSSGGADLIAVNSDNSVYVLDASRGVPRWISRLAVGSNQVGGKSVKPLIVKTSTGALIVLPNHKFVQAIDAMSGRQVWSAALPNEISSTVAWDAVAGAGSIFLLNQTKDLFLLNAATGAVQKRMMLERQPVNAGVLLGGTGLLIPVKNRAVELRNLEGEHVRFIDVGSEVTTPPLIVNSARGAVMLVGTRKSVAVFDAKSFQALGQLVIDGDDYPVGSLVAADLVGDGKPEIVVTTSRGRILAVDVAQGRTIWTRANPAGMVAPSIVDVDGDGRFDLVLPGLNNFAMALSGTDGSTIWESKPATSSARGIRPKLMMAVRSSEGRLLLVSNDASGIGLRALEVNDAFTRQSPRGGSRR